MPHRSQARMIPERFLRQLWKQTAFRTESLATTDGRPVEILSTGTLNTDGGPDFSCARIRIAGILYRGDVELHRTAQEWKQHSHDRDPKYNTVILHVVLHGAPLLKSTALAPTLSNRPVPVLALEPYLDSAYHALWEQMILGERAERLDRIRCYASNKDISSPFLRNWLMKLASERIELKVRRFEERLLEIVKERRHGTVGEPVADYAEIPFGLNPEQLPPHGGIYTARDFSRADLWEQILYEGALEALGYSKNQQPFLKLARALPREFFNDAVFALRPENEAIIRIEATLMAVAGLLPDDAGSDKASALRIAQLRSAWKKIAKLYRNEMLTGGEWQFFRMRPENFPTIRLAGAARLIARMRNKAYLRRIVCILKEGAASPEKTEQDIGNLELMFIVGADEFWSSHYRFGEPSGTTLSSLIGKNRAREIVLNVVLPICLLYARLFRNRTIRERALTLYEHCSMRQENTIVRKMTEQLVRGKFKLDSAMLQQGALQLYKLYCLDERCQDCAVGKELA